MRLPFHPSPALLGLATLACIVLAGQYGAKFLKYRADVSDEWAHPITMNIVPTFSIGLLLLSIAWLPYKAGYSNLLWLAGSSTQ